MEANSTVFRHWEDVVFEHRNKSYGAYLLRKAYADRLLSGLTLTLLFVAVLLSLQNVFLRRKPIEPPPPPLVGKGIIVQPPPVFEDRKQTTVVHPPRNPANRNTTVVVTREEVVTAWDAETVDAYLDEEGSDLGVIGTPEGLGAFTIPEPEPVIEPRFHDIAEVMPQYEGGFEAIMKFIQKKIRYPRVPRELGIQGTVYVRFIVNGDGSVSDIEILRGVHPDYDKEAARVISMLSSWKGGSQQGRPVAVRMVLPIKFNLK